MLLPNVKLHLKNCPINKRSNCFKSSLFTKNSYVWLIRKRKFFRQFRLLIWTHLLVSSFIQSGLGMGWMRVILILVGCKCSFIRVHENLVLHPCNRFTSHSLALATDFAFSAEKYKKNSYIALTIRGC